MNRTLYYDLDEDGTLRLADAADVDHTRASVHARQGISTWEDALASNLDSVELDLLVEIYQQEIDIDLSLLPDDAPFPQPPLDWALSELLVDMAADKPPSLTADPPLWLPDNILNHAEQVGDSFMSYGEAVWPAGVADDVLDQLRSDPTIRLESANLRNINNCVNATCDCPPAPFKRSEYNWLLHTLAVSGGDHEPAPVFDIVVTVADPSMVAEPSPTATHVVSPLIDSQFKPVDDHNLRTAVSATVDAIRDGKTVLVRCEAGINRSALTAGEALAELGYDRSIIVELIQARRRGALSNPFFADILRGVADTSMRRVSDNH